VFNFFVRDFPEITFFTPQFAHKNKSLTKKISTVIWHASKNKNKTRDSIPAPPKIDTHKKEYVCKASSLLGGHGNSKIVYKAYKK
jgi:hypothetical protein